jgi:hypothetical protein
VKAAELMQAHHVFPRALTHSLKGIDIAPKSYHHTDHRAQHLAF